MRFQGYTAIELPFECKPIERNARKLYSLVLEKLQLAGKDISEIRDSRTLLSRAGFSQNARNRIIHLSDEEIQRLCDSCPVEGELWDFYVREIQTLLSKMIQARTYDSFLGRPPFMGRPYVTVELADAINKLTRLRYLDAHAIATLRPSKMRELLANYHNVASVSEFLDPIYLAAAGTGSTITLQSAMRLIELYCHELVMPPRLMTRQNFDESECYYNDLSWMDDGGKEFFENMRDMPLETHYDAMPEFDFVLDWFLATKPVLDKNQRKRGWIHLEELSVEWHMIGGRYFDEDFMADCPSWDCLLADYQDEWLVVVPPDNPYTLVPLTTPMQLVEETLSMHHCVASYADSCASGRVRIFSVREKSNDQRVATAELARGPTRWEVVQLKGVCNEELLPRTSDSSDPMAEILKILTQWYNAKKQNTTLACI